MKNWKQWTFAAIIAFLGIIVGFIGCDKGDPKECEIPSIECPEKEHLAINQKAGDCCGADKGQCKCEVKEYGKIANTVPIYRTKDVDDEDAITAEEKIQQGYSDFVLAGGDVNNFLENTKEIHIVPGEGGGRNGNILLIGSDANGFDIMLYFFDVFSI